MKPRTPTGMHPEAPNAPQARITLRLLTALLLAWALTARLSAHVALLPNQVIEIDGPIAVQQGGKTTFIGGANVFRGDPLNTLLNPAASLPANPQFVDWVVVGALADTPASYGADDVAVGVIPNVTGANTGMTNPGDWYGTRIVDRIVSGEDQTIFLTGGKEDDTTTWNPGPGSIGSEKYDISEAILAANQKSLFFRTHRIGNNGTTSYRIEFNQHADSNGSLPGGTDQAGGVIPVRTEGDILIVFTVQGSEEPAFRFFQWVGASVGGSFEELGNPTVPPRASTNQVAVASSPWGYTSDGSGVWSTGSMPKYTDAEAVVPLSLLIGSDSPCGKSFFVQLRTNSSDQINSDLKDLTRIFKLTFGGPTAQANLTQKCGLQFGFNSTGSAPFNTGGQLTYAWTFYKVVGTTRTQVGTSTLASGVFNASSSGAGVYEADLVVSEGGTCTDDDTSNRITVYPPLGATASLSTTCATSATASFSYSGSGSGGDGSYTFAWSFTVSPNTVTLSGGGVTGAAGSYTSTSASGSPSVTFPSGVASATISATLTVKDGIVDDQGVECAATAGPRVLGVFPQLTAQASVTGPCEGRTINYNSTPAGGKPPYTFAWKFTQGTTELTRSDEDGSITLSAEGTWTVTLEVKDSADTSADPFVTGKPQCTTGVINVGSVTVFDALNPTAEKTSANRTALSVLLTGSAHQATSLQWRKSTDGGMNYTDVSMATGTTLNYSAFKTDDTSPDNVDFSLGSGAAAGEYKGRVWTVQLRLRATRMLNGQTCSADSPAVTVKLVEAVDP